MRAGEVSKVNTKPYYQVLGIGVEIESAIKGSPFTCGMKYPKFTLMQLGFILHMKSEIRT